MNDYTELTVDVRRHSIWIYPFELSTYSRKLNRVTGTCPRLDKDLSIYNFKIKRYQLPFELYDKSNKILKIPIGYGLDNVERILSMVGSKIHYKVIKNNEYFIPVRKEKTDIRLIPSFSPRNEYQENGINFLYHEKSIQKLLTLDTGYGKTYCTINYSAKLSEPVLIISGNLSEQWSKEIKQYTDTRNNEIYFIKGDPTIRKLMKQKVCREAFYLASTRTLTSAISTYGPKIIDQIIEKTGISTIVFDEIHLQFSANMLILTNTAVKNIVFLTATPGRSNPDENNVFLRLFANVKSYGYQTHLLKQYYNIRLVDYDTRASQFHNDICMTHKGFNGIKYMDYIIENQQKRLYLFGMMKFYSDRILSSDKDAKILIFIPGLEQIDVFRKLYSKFGISTGNYTSAIKGKDERREELKDNIIFTTLGSGSTGLDIPNLRAIFLFSPFSSHILARQVLGRLRYIPDKAVYFYDFRDLSITHMEYQRNKRMEIFGPRANKIEHTICRYKDIMDYIST